MPGRDPLLSGLSQEGAVFIPLPWGERALRHDLSRRLSHSAQRVRGILWQKTYTLTLASFTPIPNAMRLSPDGLSRWRLAFPPQGGREKTRRRIAVSMFRGVCYRLLAKRNFTSPSKLNRTGVGVTRASRSDERRMRSFRDKV